MCDEVERTSSGAIRRKFNTALIGRCWVVDMGHSLCGNHPRFVVNGLHQLRLRAIALAPDGSRGKAGVELNQLEKGGRTFSPRQIVTAARCCASPQPCARPP